MRFTVLAVPVCILLGACSDTSLPTEGDAGLRPQMAAFTQTLNLREPFETGVFISCANNGAGEFVSLSGELHVLIQLTIDGRGGFHLTTHSNPQNVSGVGDAGTTYRAVGVTSDRANIKTGETFTFRNNFRMIGRGPGNNLHIHQNFHATVNANGELSAFFDHATFACK